MPIKENWKCPVCGAESIDGMPVEHAPNCNYCENRIRRMRENVARMT